MTNGVAKTSCLFAFDLGRYLTQKIQQSRWKYSLTCMPCVMPLVHCAYQINIQIVAGVVESADTD
uniref:Uncharacterized protein n=1 Tax=Romanomermis culicivorax TaxID=13658 RepID=A0A915JQS7_ROMCU